MNVYIHDAPDVSDVAGPGNEAHLSSDAEPGGPSLQFIDVPSTVSGITDTQQNCVAVCRQDPRGCVNQCVVALARDDARDLSDHDGCRLGKVKRSEHVAARAGWRRQS